MNDTAPNSEMRDSAASKARQPRERRPPKKITQAYLENVAVHYLGRYSAPVAQLQRVLMRRCVLSCRHHGVELASVKPHLEAAIAKMIELKLVDDTRFSEGRVATLRRKGTSGKVIMGKLAAKGVARDIVESALKSEHIIEEESAHNLARRKRIGPWRNVDRAQNRERDLGVMARAGFSYAIAKAVIDADSEL